jgi:hypothetical protein
MMKNQDAGQQILKGLRETRAFFEQVSLLIRTADDLLRDDGWDNLFGKKCADVTSDLYRPKKWMPAEIFRFFIAPKESHHKDIILFVGVIFDQEGAWQGFTEPWVTCGLYQCRDDIDTAKFSDWDWVSSQLEHEHDPDGKFNCLTFTPDQQEESDGVIYQAVMALPLMSIGSAQDLKEKVVEPLLKEVQKVRHP